MLMSRRLTSRSKGLNARNHNVSLCVCVSSFAGQQRGAIRLRGGQWPVESKVCVHVTTKSNAISVCVFICRPTARSRTLTWRRARTRIRQKTRAAPMSRWHCVIFGTWAPAAIAMCLHCVFHVHAVPTAAGGSPTLPCACNALSVCTCFRLLPVGRLLPCTCTALSMCMQFRPLPVEILYRVPLRQRPPFRPPSHAVPLFLEASSALNSVAAPALGMSSRRLFRSAHRFVMSRMHHACIIHLFVSNFAC